MKKYYSQWEQDKFIDSLFPNLYNGIFVDVGAHDGITISNTYFFEKKGWTGICIEPIPDVYSQLVSNRKCTCVEGCIYNRNCELDFNRISGYSEMLSGIIEEYPEQHKNRINNEMKIYGDNNQKIIKTQAYTLCYLFTKYNLKHINYLTIDTEGSELKCLQGIDFNKVKIDVIEVEDNYPELSDDIYKLLFKENYNFLTKIGGDLIFKNKFEYLNGITKIKL